MEQYTSEFTSADNISEPESHLENNFEIKRSNYLKTFMIIISISLGFVLFGIGGFILGLNKNQSSSNEINTSLIAPSPTYRMTFTPTVEPTSININRKTPDSPPDEISDEPRESGYYEGVEIYP